MITTFCLMFVSAVFGVVIGDMSKEGGDKSGK
jgi:hypothetical protein